MNVAWTGLGSTVVRRATPDGRPTKGMPLVEELQTATVPVLSTWHSFGTLVLIPPDATHSVWWFWHDDGAFAGWYVNLEARSRLAGAR